MNEKLAEYVKNQGLEAFAGDDFTDYKLPIDYPSAVAGRILRLTSMSERLIACILHGDQGATGIDGMYPACQVNHAISFADRYLNGDTRMECGLKYAQFDVEAFTSRFNLGKAVQVPMRFDDSLEGFYYDLYADNRTGAIFTFYTGRIGLGEYSGMIFPNEEEGFRFVDWIFQNADFKDFNIGYNGLGGWGIKQFDECKDLSFLQKPFQVAVASASCPYFCDESLIAGKCYHEAK